MVTKAHGKQHEHAHAARHESDFRITARRNRLLGLWAAELLNLPADQCEAYAKEVIAADLELPGDEDVIQKVLGDFERGGVVGITRAELLKKMDMLTAEARGQLQTN